MTAITIKRFDKPDQEEKSEKRLSRTVNTLAGPVALSTIEPGWIWSEHVKPAAGTDLCELSHHGYVVSGRLGVSMRDSNELVFGPGDILEIPAGHDARVVGNEPVVIIDWSAIANR